MTTTKPRKISYFLDYQPQQGFRLGLNSVVHVPKSSTPCLPDDIMVTGGRDSTVRLWNPRDGSLLYTCLDHTDNVTKVAVCGLHVVTASSDTTVRLHEVVCSGGCPQLRPLEMHPIHTDIVTALGCDGATIASGGPDGRVVLCDAMLRPTGLTKVHDSVYSVSVHQQLLCVGTSSGRILLYDQRTLTNPIMRISGHTDVVRQVETYSSKSGNLNSLLSGASDGFIRHTDLRTGRAYMAIKAHTDAVWCFEIVPGVEHSSHTLSSPPFSILSSGRDGVIMQTNILSSHSPISKVIACCDSPVLAMKYIEDKRHLWCTHTTPHMDVYEIQDSDSVNTSQTLSPSKVGVTISDVEFNMVTPTTYELTAKTAATLAPSFPPTPPNLKAQWCSSCITPHSRGHDSLVTSSEPFLTVQGCPAIVRASVLSNRRSVLTMSDDGKYGLWDIVEMTKLKDMETSEPFFEIEKRLDQTVLKAPTWAHVDVKFGYLCVTLEPNDAFACENTLWETALAYNVGHPIKSSRELPRENRATYRTEDTVNLGGEVISILTKGNGGFHIHVHGHPHEKEKAVNQIAVEGEAVGLDQSSNEGGPRHTDAMGLLHIPRTHATTLLLPTSIFEKAYGVEHLDCIRPHDSKVPAWLNDLPRKYDTSKLNLTLMPLDPKDLSTIPAANKLSAGRCLPVFKVAEYVAEKLKPQPGGVGKERLPEDVYDIVVVFESSSNNGAVVSVDPYISIGTVHKNMKSPSVLKLFYRRMPSMPS